MKKSGTWYGEIQSSRGNILVIRDGEIPSANKGRMYLYNVDRDALIEYDEAIVSPKLVELSEQDKQQVQAQYQQSWEATRDQFIRALTKTSTTKKTKKMLPTNDLLPDDSDDNSDDDDD
jgi:hypothetical protein